MLENVKPREFAYWKAFVRIYPVGTPADDYRIAKVLAELKGGDPRDYFPGHHPLVIEETEGRRAEEIQEAQRKQAEHEAMKGYLAVKNDPSRDDF